MSLNGEFMVDIEQNDEFYSLCLSVDKDNYQQYFSEKNLKNGRDSLPKQKSQEELKIFDKFSNYWSKYIELKKLSEAPIKEFDSVNKRHLKNAGLIGIIFLFIFPLITILSFIAWIYFYEKYRQDKAQYAEYLAESERLKAEFAETPKPRITLNVEPDVLTVWEKFCSKFNLIKKCSSLDVDIDWYRQSHLVFHDFYLYENIKKIKNGLSAHSLNLNSNVENINVLKFGRVIILPGVVLRLSGSGCRALPLKRFEIDFTTSEDSTLSLQSDMSLLYKYWQHANKNGSKDKRFNDNKLIYVYRKGNLTLHNSLITISIAGSSDKQCEAFFNEAT